MKSYFGGVGTILKSESNLFSQNEMLSSLEGIKIKALKKFDIHTIVNSKFRI